MSRRALDLAFALTTFLSAALLFQVQPMVGRLLLPALGGTPAVWITCLALFQLTLLGGYLWVHLLARWLPERAQVVASLLVVGGALLGGPLAVKVQFAPGVELAPVAAIAGLFVGGVAPAYFALSATAPLLQRWYASLHGREPYRLYAVSNAGSFVGLLGYPWIVERVLDLDAQQRMWSWAFGAYAVAVSGIAVVVWRGGGPRASTSTSTSTRTTTTTSTDAGTMLGWVAWAAAPSALLSAVSEHVTTDVAAVPVLWVVPLALYLLTFVLAYGALGAGWPRLYLGLWVAASVAMPVLLQPRNQVPLPVMLGVPLATLFIGCLLCHTELARTRPAQGALTLYYVCLAAGGALGGSLCALLAPLVFSDRQELPLAMLAIHALLLRRALAARAPTAEPTEAASLEGRLARALEGAAREPREAAREDLEAALRAEAGGASGEQRLSWLGFGLAIPLLLATLWAQTVGTHGEGSVRAHTRDFFGPLVVADLPPLRVLRHGRTTHGMQWLDPARQNEPIAYFGRDTALGQVLGADARGPLRIGVVGLGVGAVAAYARPGDRLRFYEISPSVVAMARQHFGFLSHSAVPAEVVLGDGRLALAREPARSLDVLVIDAFSSDSVPVHLLTREAFGVYLDKLAPDAVLLVNVSNRHLRVERAIAGSARAHGLALRLLDTPGDTAEGRARVRWALLARRRERIAGIVARGSVLADPTPVLLTDQRAPLFALLPWLDPG
jgi:hypothetical protein